MFQRKIKKELLYLSKKYPVITITGPRQSGKTTIAKTTFHKKPYINLETFDTREMALKDPREFLKRIPNGAVLDEIQKAPNLLSYIQDIVDNDPRKGLFILTGSHQLTLHQGITQSLAGRCALLFLFPMSISELMKAKFDISLDSILIKGGYPRIYKDKLNPTKAYRNYFQTYVERDIRQLINIKNLSQFQKFIRICAGRIGQILNLEGISSDVGVSSNTIKEWISVLEASFIIIKLQPYFENFGKRMIKAPKIYFTDVGLACYLLGIENKEQIARDPLRGNLVENLIFLELIKYRYNLGMDPNIYYFRDAHGHEVDFIFQSGRSLIPIEVKAASTFNSDFFKNLHFFKKLTKDRCKDGYLIYSGEREQTIEGYRIINYKNSFKSIL